MTPQQHIDTDPMKKIYLHFTDPYKDPDDLSALLRVLTLLDQEDIQIHIITNNEVMHDLSKTTIASDKSGKTSFPMRAMTLTYLLHKHCPQYINKKIFIYAGEANQAFTQETKVEYVKEDQEKQTEQKQQSEPDENRTMRKHFSNREDFLEALAYMNKHGFLHKPLYQSYQDLPKQLSNEIKTTGCEMLDICGIAPQLELAFVLEKLLKAHPDLVMQTKLVLMGGASNKIEHNFSFSGTQKLFKILENGLLVPYIIPVDLTGRFFPLTDKNFATYFTVDNQTPPLIKHLYQMMKRNLCHINPIIEKKYGGCRLHDDAATVCAIPDEKTQDFYEACNFVTLDLAVTYIAETKNKPSMFTQMENKKFGLLMLKADARALLDQEHYIIITARVPRAFQFILSETTYRVFSKQAVMPNKMQALSQQTQEQIRQVTDAFAALHQTKPVEKAVPISTPIPRST